MWWKIYFHNQYRALLDTGVKTSFIEALNAIKSKAALEDRKINLKTSNDMYLGVNRYVTINFQVDQLEEKHYFRMRLVAGKHCMYIGQMSKVFANGPKDPVSIPGRVIPKTQKMVLDAALLSTQHYKVRIKGKVEQSREWSSTLPYTSV